MASRNSDNKEIFSEMTDQLIVSWPDQSSPEMSYKRYIGCYGYQNDQKASLDLSSVTMSHIDDVMTNL